MFFEQSFIGILICIFIFPVHFHHENNFYFFDGTAITIEYVYATIITLLAFVVQFISSSSFDKTSFSFRMVSSSSYLRFNIIIPGAVFADFCTCFVFFDHCAIFPKQNLPLWKAFDQISFPRSRGYNPR